MPLALQQPTPAPPAPAEPPKPVFGQVITQVTGQNGYEELVLAVDALRSSRLFLEAEALMDGGQGLLALDRRVFQDPPVIRALQLLQRGVNKPIASPRETLTSKTLFPELAGFRQLARLLRLHQYVLMADGRPGAAIDMARLGFRLGQVIQTDTLIAGLVGIAIGVITLRTLGEHLEQFSARDCERLFQLCLERLAGEDPMLRVLDAERRLNRTVLEEVRNADPKERDSLLSLDNVDPTTLERDPEELQLSSELGRLDASEDRKAAFISDLGQRLNDYFAQALAEARKPAWKRSRVAMPGDGSLAGRVAARMVPVLDRVADRYGSETAMVRLLAVHAAILRYRWEYDRLPKTLEALHLGELIFDPFTGQPFRYEVTGHRYRLSSAGPEDPENPRAVDGRLSVTVVPD
jgi:hypothetical protein